MMSRFFSRATTASALAAGLLVNSFAVFAQPQTQQTPPPQQQGQATTAAQKDDKNKKADKGQKDAAATPQTATTAAATSRPLADSENPSLIGKRNINKNTVFSSGGSVEKEVNLGRQLAAEVDKQAKFVDDPVITEYVNRVGQNVVLHSDAKIPFTIKVVDAEDANAFALPGGFFYVNKGLILAADNEAELAGVMAHEIAHVTARHAMENMKKGQWIEGLAMAGSILLGGIPGMIYQSTAGFGIAAIFFKFTRSAEEEADKLGAQYLYAAGYDPGAMSTMFEKLLAKNKKKPGFFAKTFSTHPQTADRMEASRVLVARFPDREEYVLSTSEFQRVKARLLRLSNARASTVGDLAAGESGDGTPGRPTLKRRQPPPPTTDGAPTTTTTTDGGEQPATTQQNEPPKLKRRDTTPDPATTQKPPTDNE